jgi:hypothetical protein
MPQQHHHHVPARAERFMKTLSCKTQLFDYDAPLAIRRTLSAGFELCSDAEAKMDRLSLFLSYAGQPILPVKAHLGREKPPSGLRERCHRPGNPAMIGVWVTRRTDLPPHAPRKRFAWPLEQSL